jgi:5'-nucleotidase
MAQESSDKLVIAISSRALFDLDESNRIFETQGLDSYRTYQVERELEVLRPGTGFPLVKALLSVNGRGRGELVEVVLVSRNDADTGLRVMNSVESYGLAISRACFTDGAPAHPYLSAFACDLFLSKNADDVVQALANGYAAALVYQPPEPTEVDDQIVRIAFDGDAVLFSPEYERTYRALGLAAFHRQEKEAAEIPMRAGPFKRFLERLHAIQQRFPEEDCPIRTALVTARSVPAHKRAVNTLRAWNIRIDEAFFLGGRSKQEVLKVFRPHIYFDDQSSNCVSAARATPTAQVPAE